MELLYTEINECRSCKSDCLTEVFNLGRQKLTGVFPLPEDEEKLESGEVTLCICENCSLVQMKQTYNSTLMYGDNYGYRTGLNASMVKHIQNKFRSLENRFLSEGATILDIGSNDGTGLKSYIKKHKLLVGIDPSANKFSNYYSSDSLVISDFFSSKIYHNNVQNKADLVTSVAMFYDLPDPVDFAKNVEEILAENGVWHLEQSYAPEMVRTLAYDTICQEHIEFYSLKSLMEILHQAKLKIIDVNFNKINGGSIALTVAKEKSKYLRSELVKWILNKEAKNSLNSKEYYYNFCQSSLKHAADIKSLLTDLKAAGKTVFAYGASTKGNVMLQLAGIDNSLIDFVVEVNEDKFGKVTPGSRIPIISEAEGEALMPDYYLVLPWHFRESIISRSARILERGAKFIFPNPTIEIYGW